MKLYLYDIRKMENADYQYWYSVMSHKKQQRVDEFHFFDDRKRTVSGEMLIRKAISNWCDISAEDILFDITEHGKPYAKDLPIEFNISHSGNIVACAVDDKPIGIDIEKIRPVDLSIAKRICSFEEMCYLFGHDPEEQDFVYTANIDILARFFEIWTIKEAFIKYSGFMTELQTINSYQCRKSCFFIDIKEYICCIYHDISL